MNWLRAERTTRKTIAPRFFVIFSTSTVINLGNGADVFEVIKQWNHVGMKGMSGHTYQEYRVNGNTTGNSEVKNRPRRRRKNAP